MPPVAPIEVLADVTDGTYEEGARPPVFLQPARSAPSDSPPDSPSDDAEESGKLPAMIVESEADTFGGTRHLWTDGVWRPDGTEPHDAEHVVFANGTQYPVYLTVSPKDGKYHPLKEESDEEKLARHGPVESAHPVFRAAIDEVSGCTEPLLPQPLLQVLYPAEIDEPMYAEAIQQPQCASSSPSPAREQDTDVARTYALGRLWAACEPGAKYCTPCAVVGHAVRSVRHSLGEYVAAVFSGALDCATAAALVRGRLMAESPSRGAMMSVRASPEAARRAVHEAGVAGRAAVACLNGPTSVVISGEWAAISAAVKRLPPGTKVTRVAATHADHSPAMAQLAPALAARAAELYRRHRPRLAELPRRPSCPWVSSVTGDVVSEEEAADPAYWAKHLTAPDARLGAVRSLLRVCSAREKAPPSRAPTSRFERSRAVVVVEMGEGMLTRGIRVEDTSSPSAGEAILESCCHDNPKADAAESAAEYCARVEARIEELMEPVRRERLTRFLLEPDSVDEAEVELACAEPVQLPPS
ncbi:hypothetical protein EMIHUDRAFT_230345 [Emiliania huxleyi CCMP1516]|uniref:Malonyl-CoA:ACP transacylase (MAT) domain-containing protein n=2 Tax=Emiliania huxleyi TaxID=2903 RepID=A0A0D3KAI3_EMIH1|nr:hypothetical protein EMIHUDRAFT_230345 [Emiliania huxleyi CCMP1516]EOD32768.1 hypothetical protein EMIHUDRAFT_230345 [Emiliania huxleyi CCMP1516]|eukprot:XP_005785197.1 hypothetical protein EMIHUDRAFT_230345 [Emiliania huxleyi CCMP1516]